MVLSIKSLFLLCLYWKYQIWHWDVFQDVGRLIIIIENFHRSPPNNRVFFPRINYHRKRDLCKRLIGEVRKRVTAMVSWKNGCESVSDNELFQMLAFNFAESFDIYKGQTDDLTSKSHWGSRQWRFNQIAKALTIPLLQALSPN